MFDSQDDLAPAGVSQKLQDVVDLVSDSDISSIKNITSGIIRIINNPESSARDLKELIEIDPPLTAKILRISNSSYYYSRTQISSIEQAVVWLGFETLKEIALSQKVCEIFRSDKTIHGYSRTKLWKHSIAVALLGKMIYRMEYGEPGENIYAAGLLHDIGIIALDQFFRDEFISLLKTAYKEKREFVEGERELWGYTHQDIGGKIAEEWLFPTELCLSIGCHHLPSEELEESVSKICSTLYVADHLCHEYGFESGISHTPDYELFNQKMEELGLNMVGLEMIMKRVSDELAKMEEKGLL